MVKMKGFGLGLNLILFTVALNYGSAAIGQNNPAGAARSISKSLVPSPSDDQVQRELAKRDLAIKNSSSETIHHRLDLRQAAAVGRWPTTSSATGGLGY